MIKSEIECLLRLQHSAYELLMWLNKRAEQDPDILNDQNLEKWRFAQSCEAWVREVYGMIPQALRPAHDEIPAFAHLFSSFFQTSFRLTENAPSTGHDYFGHEYGYVGSGKRKLIAASPGGKKSPQAKAKVADSMRELRLIALEELALENELFPTRAALGRLERRNGLREALTIWTYVQELNRRAHFSSQGEAVRSLWLAIDKKERESLNATMVIQVRDVLLTALKSC